MKYNVTISVLMAVYNTEFSLVKRAIDSVLKQTFQDFELIILDDGSDNDADKMLMSYAKKFPQKITYLHHQNQGQSMSINRGIACSHGQYIAILDADDEYKPTHLMACLKEMQFADLIASTTETIVDNYDDYFVPDKYDTSKVIHIDDCVLFATLFGRKEVFVSQKFKDMYAADAHFYENAALCYTVNKVHLKTYKYYRNSLSSACSTLKKKNRSAVV